MPDNLYLNLWFSDSELVETFAHAAAVMQQLPFSAQLPGVSGVAVHPISWSEATILEENFRPGISPEEAVTIAAGLPHEDYAYVFEVHWDLWSPLTPQGEWTLRPSSVKVIVRGDEFEDAESDVQGQLQVDFGLDAPFLYEELQLSDELESKVRSNVQKLVDFTSLVEKNSGAKTRLLWSESEENLAQKLVSRLQRVN
jgi:hypothetical protein